MTEAEEKISHVFSDYGGGEEMPVEGYAVLLGTYATLAGAAFVFLKDRFPDHFSMQDLLLTAVATHKLSRTVTLGKVTSPLRAPVASFERKLGSGEVEDRSEGRGLKLGIGHLLTCPFCFGTWTAAAMTAGWGAAPRLTRMVAMTFSAAAASDFLNQIYIILKRKARA